ncbi:hypothetical protein O0A22_11605 [Staphylococcus pseudintermedius]|nr:hypothetical protein [Staphylococcus pseudintermedius]
MRIIKLEETIKQAHKNKQRALEVVRNLYDPHFNYGDRKFDRPRCNPDKAKILQRLEEQSGSNRQIK